MKIAIPARCAVRARCALFLLAAFAAATTLPAAENDDAGWIPMAERNGHLTIEVDVDGEPATVLLDTGATGNAISTRFAERAGVRPDRSRRARVTGVFGERTVYLSQMFTIDLGGRNVPLSGLMMLPGTGYDIIFGQDFFELVTVQIDYPGHRVRFLPSDAVAFESNVRLKRGRNREPLLETRVHGRRAWMLLDTGNSGLSIFTRRAVRRHDLEDYRIEAARTVGQGVHEIAELHLLQLESLELGPFTFSEFLAAYSADPNEGLDGRRSRTMSRIRRAKTTFDGILGYEALRNFVVTMDLGENRLHLGLPPRTD